ncbi:MAG: amidohydrolase family protein [Micromonosporaceae bacterium]|nr:amidohydrolase family protein [Micromonosporaceae bacterium]
MNISKVITGGTAITMSDGGDLPDAVVVLSGSTIAGVYPAGQAPPDVTAWVAAHPDQVLDASGRYLIPGLVNLHEHLDMHNVPGSMHDRVAGPVRTLVPRVVRNAILSLAKGVTTVRDLGSKGATNILMRNIVDSGQFVGPRILGCGQMIAATGGHGQPLCAEADGADGMRHVTRRQIKSGADVIKVCASGGVVAMPRENPWAQQLSDEELAAVVTEAHRHGLQVASHAHPPAAIRASVLAGVNTIEHGAFLDQECADLMAARSVSMVPTVDDSFVVAGDGERHGRPPWMMENAGRSIDVRMKSIGLAIDAGVRLGAGTDVVGRIGHELAHLAEAGLTARQALAAGTSGAADILGLSEIGRIAAGSVADLVILRRDPLADLTRCDTDVELVVRAGTALDPAALLALCNGGRVV